MDPELLRHIASKLVFDAAEAVLVEKYVSRVMVSLSRFNQAVDTSDGLGALEAWQDAGRSLNYLSSVMDAKVQIAFHDSGVVTD